MMDSLPPLTRRVIALGLLALLVLVAITQLVIPLVDTNRDALRDLKDVREARARAEAIRAAPEPRPVMPFPTKAGLRAADVRTAGETFVGQLASSAARQGLQIAIVAMPRLSASAPAPINLKISVTGRREALLDWMSKLERGAPAVRLRDWQLSDQGQVPAIAGPQPVLPNAVPAPPVPTERLLRLDASVVALWIGAS